MPLPDAKITDTGLIPHVEKDSKGRKTRAYATIRGDARVAGTTVSSKARRAMDNNEGYQCGHIIPTCWGGSGHDTDNLFPQWRGHNQSTNRVDADISKFLAADPTHSIEIDFHFSYENDNGSTNNTNQPTKYGAKITFYKAGTYYTSYDYQDYNRDCTDQEAKKNFGGPPWFAFRNAPPCVSDLLKQAVIQMAGAMLLGALLGGGGIGLGKGL